jgi:predicted alpha/beta superfamily hydrolase
MPQWKDYPLPGNGREQIEGTMLRHPSLHSPELGNSRDVFVYLPPSYEKEPERRYPVLYMHDGQNLFDDRTSFAGAWRVDRALDDAGRVGLDAIVVALPNAGRERINEYSPFIDPRHGGGRGETYMKFIVETVKPHIDGRFRTVPDRHSTGLAGSSMGGLISMYGYFQHPTVFGFCGVLSPAFWFAQGAIYDFMEQSPYVPGRIYIDCGTSEGEKVHQDVRRACQLLHAKGYQKGRDLLCVVEPGAGHTEQAWSARLQRALRFLLRRPSANGGRPEDHDPGPISAAHADDLIRR